MTDDDFKLMRKMLRKREEKRQSDGIDQLDQLDEEVE